MSAGAQTQRGQFNLLFGVMLVISAGNVALQSVMPSMGRTLHMPDTMIAATFSVSALVWALAAPFWAKRSERTGNRRMVLMGLAGFTVSIVGCGAAIAFGIAGWIGTMATFIAFSASRLIYGTFGAAAMPAAQAIVASRTSRAERTNALTMLASAFGLGTILGPAAAPFFVIAPLGLAGPAFAFAIVGIVTFVLAARELPDDAPGSDIRGAAASEPSIGGEPSGASVIAALNQQSDTRLALTDPRIWPWVVVGLIAGHAQAISAQAMGFLIIDRLHLDPVGSQSMIGLVLMAGAGTALLGQWGLIPRLKLPPAKLVLYGALLSALGCAGIAFAHTIHALSVAFALASLGFGFLRPGFTAGSSLAVGSREQGQVAGRVTSVNGAAYVFGPLVGISLYQIDAHIPYLIVAVALAGMALYGWRRLGDR